MNSSLARCDTYISPNGNHYEFLDNIDSGTFGQVIKAWRKGTGDLVALKIIKNFSTKLVQNEVTILTQLMKENPEEYNIVSAFESFHMKNDYFLVFEMLEQNLHDYQKQTAFAPISLNCIRPVVYQVLKALWKLKSLGLVHADLKPENIMLVDPAHQPFRVKVIDFGSSFYRTKIENHQPYIQSRYYRAPEILIGAPFSEAMDMWSLGCIMVELFLGTPLYPGGSEYDMMRYIVSTQGDLPRQVLGAGKKATNFFKKKFHKTVGTPVSWRLRNVAEVEAARHTNNKETRKIILASLDDLLRVAHPHTPVDAMNKYCEQVDRMQFVALLKRLLELDQSQRITPWESIQHPFVSLPHLAAYAHSEYVKDTQHRMEICGGNVPLPAVYPLTPSPSPLLPFGFLQ